MTRSASEALAWARAQHDNGSRNWHNICLIFVHDCFNVGAYYPSASRAWYGAAHKHPTTDGNKVPRGVPYFWTGGSQGFGHIVISAGGGLCWSTDINVRGGVSLVRINDITRRWGQNPAGWTEDLNKVRVYTPSTAPAKPVIDLSEVLSGLVRHQAAIGSVRLKKAVIAEVGKGQMSLSPVLGERFKTQYRKVQEEYLHAIGAKVTASSADGVPGMASLRWLGDRHGFSVRA